MDLVTILIFICQALIVLGLLAMLGFGIRALIGGRKNYIAIGSMVLALVVFVVAFAMANPDAYAPINGNEVTKPEAAIVLTAVAMFFLSIGALLVSAVRGFFK